LLAVSFIDWLDLTRRLALSVPPVRSRGSKLDSGVWRLVTQTPAEYHGADNGTGCPTAAAERAVRIGGENAAGEQWRGLNEPKPEHLRALRRRKAFARMRTEMRDYRGVGRAPPAM
jgi:hypothetical protein